MVLAVANGVLLKLALGSRVASMDERPYERGLEYEDVVGRKQAASRDGLKQRVLFEDQQVLLRYEGLPPNGEWKIRLRLLKPDNALLDILHEGSGAGDEFSLPIPRPRSGLWLLSVALEQVGGESKRYLIESREFLP